MSIKQIICQNETQCNTNKESNQYIINNYVQRNLQMNRNQLICMEKSKKYPYVSTF